MKQRGTKSENCGTALSADTVANSIDAELIASGPSGKGPQMGSIERHGSYVVWGFNGPVSAMTNSGRALFVNAVYYTASVAGAPVIEKRTSHGTRDELYEWFQIGEYGIKQYPQMLKGFVHTLQEYLPADLADKALPEIEKWHEENRPYLRARMTGTHRYLWEVDAFAKQLQIPNHKKAYLEKCIANLERDILTEESSKALQRYTGLDYTTAQAWRLWYTQNRDYLYFSDCDGFIFKIDQEAKRRHIPTAVLRNWSSENIDYRYKTKRTNN